MEMLHIGSREQRLELCRLRSRVQRLSGKARPIAQVDVGEDRHTSEPARKAHIGEGAAPFGVNEDRARLRKMLRVGERIVGEEEALLLPDGECRQTLAAWSGAEGAFAMHWMSIGRRAERIAHGGGNL